eukprot:8445399-Lingulodinium_polyedra.AAC.1
MPWGTQTNHAKPTLQTTTPPQCNPLRCNPRACNRAKQRLHRNAAILKLCTNAKNSPDRTPLCTPGLTNSP